ncbi:hypothetical protein [Ramlibacter algicola]|uniref:NnrS family protein n=1 Tax=Ramlibacter algicola TaxID=2795217 RepID=A0A934UQF2_9BURK|nr:hypothetical protein [Ramlibacter algicola]MBK0392574.1 hypothetical protein [Ramlibacter algicola]
MPAPGRIARPAARPARLAAAGPLLAAAAVLAGIAAFGGGLLRAGVPWPGTPGTAWATAAALHGALVIGGMLGTVIGLERAVALRHPLGWTSPVASALAAAALLAGRVAEGALLLALASACFVAVNVALMRRQPAPHTRLLVLAAAGWLAGNVLFAAAAPADAIVPWWFTFLVATIAAERLEMTRLMRRHPAAEWRLHALLALLVAGAAATFFSPRAGGAVFGAALLLLAGWFLRHDIARRTLHAPGLPRYMAVCLLAGYGWLGIGGIAWIATAYGAPVRDAALHAIGLGFVASMVLGHAPVILPAIAGWKLAFGRAFYLPLALLHLTLLARLAGGAVDATWRAAGAAGNALALLVFIAVVAGAVAWRRRALVHDPRAEARAGAAGGPRDEGERATR